MTLYEDAVRVLAGWSAPDAAQEALRLRFLGLLRDHPDAIRANHPGAHLTASMLVVDATGSRVLLCLHGRIRKWMQVGGHLEPEDPTLTAAALREATEETGIAGLTVRPAPVHLDIHHVASCRHGPADHYDVRFAATAPPGTVGQVSDESAALGWFDPDTLPDPLSTGIEALIAAAGLRHRRTGQSRAHEPALRPVDEAGPATLT